VPAVDVGAQGTGDTWASSLPIPEETPNAHTRSEVRDGESAGAGEGSDRVFQN